MEGKDGREGWEGKMRGKDEREGWEGRMERTMGGKDERE